MSNLDSWINLEGTFMIFCGQIGINQNGLRCQHMFLTTMNPCFVQNMKAPGAEKMDILKL